jgi:hypothetical protein
MKSSPRTRPDYGGVKQNRRLKGWTQPGLNFIFLHDPIAKLFRAYVRVTQTSPQVDYEKAEFLRSQ